ncbi:MAG TPA: hypothetical protein VI217_07915 [Mycobacterium sp.]
MTTHEEQTSTRSESTDNPSSATPEADSPSTQDIPVTAGDGTSMTSVEQPEVATDSSTAEAEPSTGRSLFADDLSGLRSRWDDVQAGFVDDPKDCVQKADALVADVVERLTTGFSEARSRLEAQWDRGEEASTEDLRQTLKRYREFFERLLAV